ncbi:general secretion pathway protein GspB [Photobacterium sp. DA100]|uniref:general secretion pathway protein GspB n=1 Tax=Photobacterium sp. DA100 TaxID=3027472 RepID=UPI002478D4B1|nr:general secretion pathway protein GspB [Photobacterium sp. DA100]WEM41983.1 general secretion pathway protein GspB [Photobacterium sp. DA100]
MSKLLSALAQSDAQRTPATPPSVGAFRSGPAAKPATPWLLPGVGFALPVIGMLGYLFFQQQQTEPHKVPQPQAPEHQVAVASEVTWSRVSVPAAEGGPAPVLEPAAEIEVPKFPQGIEKLDYPQLYAEPLPSQQGQPYRARSPQTASVPVRAGSVPNGWDSEPAPLPASVELPVNSSARKSGSSVDDSWDLEALDYSELSPQLANQLRAAIAATGEGETLPQLLQEERLPSMPEPQAPLSAVSIGDLPASVQNRIPSLNFQTHIYSSSADSRWVKVNGSEAYEGDEIAPGVVLRRIEPRAVVFDFESYLVSMPALSEW